MTKAELEKQLKIAQARIAELEAQLVAGVKVLSNGWTARMATPDEQKAQAAVYAAKRAAALEVAAQRKNQGGK